MNLLIYGAKEFTGVVAELARYCGYDVGGLVSDNEEDYKRVKKAGYNLPPLIHPESYVADSTSDGDGVMIMAGAIVGVKLKVGDLSVLWPGACLNHNSMIGNNLFISPNVTICGACTVRNNTFIGAGAVIVEHCNMPDQSFIKANATFKRKL